MAVSRVVSNLNRSITPAAPWSVNVNDDAAVHQACTFQHNRTVVFCAQERKTEYVSTANIEPEPQPKEREIGPFVVEPLTTDKWLGDAFYRERTGGSGEPQGTIPQD